jgi:hypothetical protein
LAAAPGFTSTSSLIDSSPVHHPRYTVSDAASGKERKAEMTDSKPPRHFGTRGRDFLGAVHHRGLLDTVQWRGGFAEHPRNGAEIGLALGNIPGGGVAGHGLLLLEAALRDFSYGS